MFLIICFFLNGVSPFCAHQVLDSLREAGFEIVEAFDLAYSSNTGSGKGRDWQEDVPWYHPLEGDWSSLENWGGTRVGLVIHASRS